MSLIYIDSNTILDDQCFNNVPLLVKVGLKFRSLKEERNVNNITALEIQEACKEYWKNYPFKQTTCGTCYQEIHAAKQAKTTE